MPRRPVVLTDDQDKTLGRLRTRLMTERVALGLGQIDVATALNVTQSTIAYWESGRISPPLQQFVRWVELLGLTIELTGCASAVE